MSIMSAEPGHIVHVDFCDHSEAETKFALTQFGSLKAREQYTEMCEMGSKNNTIYTRFPHVNKVVLVLLDDATEEPLGTDVQEYLCACVRKEGASA